MGDTAPDISPHDIQVFRDIFDESPIGIAVENLQGEPFFVNPAFCSFLGFNENELSGKHCVDFSPKEDAEKDWALFQQLRTGAIGRYQLKKRYFRRDGSLVWGRLSVSLLNNRPSPLVLAMVEDITEQKRGEEALQESEERLRLAVQAGRMFAYSWDAATDIIERTGESEEILGVKNDQATTGAAVSAMVHPDDKQRLEAALANLTVENPFLRITYRIIRPDGTVVWLERNSRAYFDAQGGCRRVVGMIVDVTERKLAEERLREYQKAVEGAEDMIGVIDREYRFLLVNRQYLKMHEMTREQVVGRLISEVLGKDVFETVLKPKLDECFKGNVVTYERKFSYPTAGERDLSLSYFPIEGPDGIDRAACILRDITDRKRDEQSLQESEQRFRLAAQAGRMYSFDWDVTTDIVVRSAERIKIVGATEPLSFSHAKFVETIHPEDRPKFLSATAELTPENPIAEVIYRVRGSDGAFVWLKSSGRAFFDQQGRMLRVVGMVADVTDLKQAEGAVSGMTRKLIEALERERTRIARELHDDITQRLALVSIELDQLRQNPSEIERRVEELRKKVAEISNDAQSLSHDLHSSKLEYLGVITGLKGWCREFAERQKLQIEFRSDVSRTIPVEVGVSLFRVLQEALHNASKHSGVRRFEVEMREKSNEIHLTVSDFGRGFNVEDAMRGKGLGLTSICERIRLLNGTISIESKPTAGTTIRVRVPLQTQQSSQSMAG